MPRRGKKLTIEDLFRFKVPQTASISPDGEQIVFSVKYSNGKKNKYNYRLFRMGFDGGRAEALTRGHVNDTDPLWSPNGKHIAFLSDREDDTTNIWSMPAGGGEPVQVSRLKGGPIMGLQWAPDGKSLLFLHRLMPKKDPEKKKTEASYKHITRLNHKFDGMGFYYQARWQLWVVSFPSGTARQLTKGPWDITNAAWAPNGKRIAFLSNQLDDNDNHQLHSDIFTITPKGRSVKKITKRQGLRDSLCWSADSKTIYYTGNYAGPGEWIRHTIPVKSIPATGGGEKVLTPDIDNWTLNMVVTDTVPGFGGGVHRYDEKGDERIAFYLDEEGACRLYSVSARGGDIRLEFGGDVNSYGVTVSSATGKAAVVAAHMSDVGDLYSLTLNGDGESKRRTRLNDTLMNGLALSEPEEIWFRNGKTKIQGWVLKPPGFRKDRKYPCVLEVHGGPMCQYGYTFFHEMHLLAAEGYIVAYSNPRGSSGRGLKYMNCIEGNWGKLDYSDCMAVVNSMARKRYVDGKRLGILGGSYGGFMTTWVVGHTNRFQAAVTQRALGNWTIQFGSSDYGWDNKYELNALPWRKPLHYLKLSPNYYVDNIKTPLLIIHSENDLRCPIAQSEELFTSLKVLGRTTEMVRFEGESHGLSRGGKPANRRERLSRILDWFDRYL